MKAAFEPTHGTDFFRNQFSKKRGLVVGQLTALLCGLTMLGVNLANAAAPEPYGLAAMEHFDRLPYLKLDTMAGGQSSYDRAGGNRDFSNFLYATNGEQVLLDLKGPGTVYRMWFTGFDPSPDYLKVYFDGESTPRINMRLKDIFSGNRAPFLAPLVGNNLVSSGGFFCYLPLPFGKSIRLVSNATAGSFYYNLGYHIYSSDTAIRTWTGKEDSRRVRNIWSNATKNPQSEEGLASTAKVFDLAAGGEQTLLDIKGPKILSALKLHIPGMEPPRQSLFFTDDGRAHKGFSQFRLKVTAANSGVTLVRRLDYGVGDQKANVYIDGAFAGQWFDAGSDGQYHWRDHAWAIPQKFTEGKSFITVKIAFVSSAIDWNEFHYWAWSMAGTTSNLSDTLDVGNLTSEREHDYEIVGQTWAGAPNFQSAYRIPPAKESNQADLLTNLWLKISFEGETNPSVWAPVGSFFAVGQFATFQTRALPVGMDTNDDFYVYFPMPFARRAQVQLISKRSRPTTNIACVISDKPFTDSLANVGYFTTAFQAELPTTNGYDIRILDAEGCGHFVGVVASMLGPVSRGHLEGDERIYVDDSRTPAIYGTGTEDFYNGGWYFEYGIFTQPLHGNPVHLADDAEDRTTAYRLLLQDAVPFRKHIRVGIEHGGTDDVAEKVWTLAYYYRQPRARATLTDALKLGDKASEKAHHYTVSGQTWSGSRTYSFDGELDWINSSAAGYAHQGRSQFKMALAADNAGAILRRQFDQGIANQRADVYVDGELVGEWYRAGANTDHRWRDDDFMIPARYTAGKAAIEIRIQYVSSAVDWNEFGYSLFTLAGPPGDNN